MYNRSNLRAYIVEDYECPNFLLKNYLKKKRTNSKSFLDTPLVVLQYINYIDYA